MARGGYVSPWVPDCGSLQAWQPGGPPTLDLSEYNQITFLSPEDQVVSCGIAMPLTELNCELAKVGYTVPYHPVNASETEFVGTFFGLNLPHASLHRFGSFKDWILAVTARAADGREFRAGSRAVKNVAGFDIHRFLAGGRSSFALPLELTLRVFPLKSVPVPDRNIKHVDFFQRVPRTACDEAKELFGDDFDPVNRMVASQGEPQKRWPGDWVASCSPLRAEVSSAGELALLKRLKASFDPENRLPGLGYLEVREP